MSAARFDEILGATLASLRDNFEGEADQVERDEQGSMIDWIDRFISGRSIARSLTEHAQRLAGPLSERERTMLVNVAHTLATRSLDVEIDASLVLELRALADAVASRAERLAAEDVLARSEQ